MHEDVATGVRMLLSKVLVVGKSESVQQLVRRITNEIYASDDVSDAWDILHKQQIDLIIIDTTVRHEHKCTFLDMAKNETVPPIVIMSDDTNSSTLEHYLPNAFDVLDGNADLSRITQIAQRIKDASSTAEQGNAAACADTQTIIGHSTASIKTLELIDLVAKSNCNPVLIIGETGTGKEMAARRIHELRHGRDNTYVGINCAALSASLLESELFGHVKGAFTGADREKTGLLELAQNGTVLLDEISEMPLDLQAKLLRVLQERTFRKVGGIKELTCTATIAASSNRNLYKEAQSGKFRQDLYYRLAVCPITISPLRSPDRKDDIPLLAEHFLQTSTICPDKIKRIAGFTKLAIEAMLEYAWPGNVRELRNVIDRAILLETTDKIGLSSLIFNPEQHLETSTGQTISTVADFSLEKAEKELIGRALKQAGWQKTRAATLLGITRATLYAKISQYDIKVPAPNESFLAETAA
jgi:two-component system response regulator HydG